MIARTIFAAGVILLCGHAGASGDPSYDRFVNRSMPDIDSNRYQAGALGVVLPSYDRVYLYAAWRAIALGTPQLKIAPHPADGLARAAGNPVGGWLDAKHGAATYAAWQQAISAALKQPLPSKSDGDRLAAGALACPLSSYAFATATLSGLARRADATPARLRTWIDNQKQVFKFCGDDAAAPQRVYGGPKPVIAAPLELPASEALYWRQMQQYQLASAAFYGGDYASSERRFSQIGATEQHPLRQWGDYLSLRSMARDASHVAESPASAADTARLAPISLLAPEVRLGLIQARADRILNNPALSELHESSRAIVRAMQAQLTPAARFAQLSKLLADPRADPYLDDHLGDWRLLAELQLNDSSSTPELKTAVQQLRKVTGFFDWIETMQECKQTVRPERQPEPDACQPQRAHAAAEWHRHTAAGDQSNARIWLTAMAAMGTTLPADAERAALQIPPGAPEYLTMRYALVRHYRLSHQGEKARAIADSCLTGGEAHDAVGDAHNLFLQERFALATTPADAARFLLRAPSRRLDADTGEQAAAVEPPQPAADGLVWLNSGVATADLLALTVNKTLDAPLRGRIAVAAWMRADLLAQDDTALKAAGQAAQLMPELAEVMARYRRLPDAPARRHWMIINALKYSLSPVIASPPDDNQVKARDSVDVLADMWCNIPAANSPYGVIDTETELSPPPPDTGNAAARDQEMAALGRIKTATGFIGDHVMQYASVKPNDPDLPWMLYMVVQSTRGGCLDADSKALSKRAYALLHKRYKNSQWTEQTPYFY